MEPTNVDEIETVDLVSTATPDAQWIGGFFAYGGTNGAVDTVTIYFKIPPGKRLGRHVDTAEEVQFILGGSGQLLLDDGPKDIRAGDAITLAEGVAHDLHNTGTEDLQVIGFFNKAQVEQHWSVERWPPDDNPVTGSPNREAATA